MELSMQVDNLSKYYHGNQVVKDISFQIKKGEIFAFLGPNGAGKSTTISMLSTLLKKDGGQAMVEGFQLGVDDTAIRSKIGIVFQDSVLDELLSVEQNLLLRSALYNIPHRQAKQRVEEVCSLCNLGDIRKQSVGTLSGGQRRRCDIARALLQQPSILILDEPSTGLDPKARKQLWETIRKLHQEHHMTVFMTTHYLEEAEISDHLCILKQGTIVLDMLMKDIHTQYAGDQLRLYSGNSQDLSLLLKRHHIPYQKQNGVFCIRSMNLFHTMSILRLCEHHIEHFENRKQTIEDIYLQLLQEDEEA